MEKRLILAISLSLAILLGWSFLVNKTQLVGSKDVTTAITQPVSNKNALITQASLPATPPAPVVELPTVEFANNKVVVTFTEQTAAIKEVKFKDYKDYVYAPLNCLALVDPALKFHKSSVTSDSITFTHSDPAKSVAKKFIFHKDNYTIGLEIVTHNFSSGAIEINPSLSLGQIDLSSKNMDNRYQEVIISTSEKTLRVPGRKDQEFYGVKFLAVRDRYCCAIIESKDKNIFSGAFIRNVQSGRNDVGLVLSTITIPANGQIGHLYNIYVGPQDLKLIGNVNSDWTNIIHFGFFDFIGQLLLQLLNFIYRFVPNWGWTIVIFSVLVYLLLFPLTLKQMRSMKEMQAIQPKVEELRKLYKDNPQRLNKEVMELYKEHKVNPFGGCLPLLLQMPIFFSLYQVLMRSVALRGAQFLWIKDLSGPDRLFTLPKTLPIIGNEFNLLPILMALGMFAQQKATSAMSVSSEQAQQQKIMLFIMPVMLVVFFYRLPSGLVLYWVINSALMSISQLRLSKAK